jgi:hypothetical protein
MRQDRANSFVYRLTQSASKERAQPFLKLIRAKGSPILRRRMA